jgi:hypothetical protein
MTLIEEPIARPRGLIDYIPKDLDITDIALDIFGTLLVADSCDDSEMFPYPRPGYEKHFDSCNKRNIRVITSSDMSALTVRMCLQDQHFPLENPNLIHFMIQCPNNGIKDFESWASVYGEIFKREINPKKLVVIGDNFHADILGAEEFGAYSIFVPRYKTQHPEGVKETKYQHLYTPRPFSELVEV